MILPEERDITIVAGVRRPDMIAREDARTVIDGVVEAEEMLVCEDVRDGGPDPSLK